MNWVQVEESTADNHQGRQQHTPWRVVLLRTLCEHGMLHTPGCQKFTLFSGPLLVLLTWYIRNGDNLSVLTQRRKDVETLLQGKCRSIMYQYICFTWIVDKGRGVTIPSTSLLFVDSLLGYLQFHLFICCGCFASRN